MDWLLAPFTADSGLPAALQLALIGAACGAVGVWVLHFGQAILAESFTHALLPGLALAAALGAGLALGALVGVALAWLLILLAVHTPQTSEQTGISIAVSALLGVGALIGTTGGGVEHFEELLFGEPLAASWSGVALSGALGLLIALALLALAGPFSALAFDRVAAPGLGVNVGVFSAAALLLLAVAVSAAASISGSLLALALVTGPAWGALTLTSRLRSALLLAAASGAASGFLGTWLAWQAELPGSSGTALVICAWAVLAPLAAALLRPRVRLG